MHDFRRLFWLTCSSLMVIPSGPVIAQTTEIASRSQDDGAADPGLLDIVVQARKRDESIHQVPVVATVLSQEQIEQFATNDLYRISDRVPGLVIGTGIGAFGNQVSLRGVGTSVLNSTIDQSISLAIDGLQLTQGLAYSAAMFDMAQISVLKGPQSLFFGKASPGGVISITTADPTSSYEVIARAGYEFEALAKQAELVLSGPVADGLGVRLAARFSDLEDYHGLRPVIDSKYGFAALPEALRQMQGGRHMGKIVVDFTR